MFYQLQTAQDFLKGFLRGLRRLLIFETFLRALGKKLSFCPGENRNPVFCKGGYCVGILIFFFGGKF